MSVEIMMKKGEMNESNVVIIGRWIGDFREV